MYWNEEKAGWVPSFDMVESASFKNADLFTAVVTVQYQAYFHLFLKYNIWRKTTYITLDTITINYFDKYYNKFRYLKVVNIMNWLTNQVFTTKESK